jgi:hypothetical protein
MAEPEDGQDVLGSLPRRRPGIKSPRRAGAKAAAEQRAAAPPPPSRPRAPEPQPGDLERLARAGVSIVGGATAVGLKLAGRTIGGLGRVVGRR